MYQNIRYLKLDTEWTVIHLPERPNGFGVFIIGDKNSFVEDNTSFWMQNLGRYRILGYLLDKGYTVFYSNLYGPNWGSPRSLSLAIQLYHIILKREILNDKIHILAEGMGALVALQLMNKMEEKIRSVAMINPCIDLIGHLEYEKNHKFFYKKLVKELAVAYDIDERIVMNNFESFAPKIDFITPNTPVKIWQSTSAMANDLDIHSRKYQEVRKQKNKEITLSYHLSEKEFSFSQSVCQFFYEHERRL